MRRWNGWGDQATMYPLPESAAQYLADIVGSGSPLPDAKLDQVVAAVPTSRIPAHELITIDPAERARYARGQSLPDWVALRSGQIDAFPDGVARPADDLSSHMPNKQACESYPTAAARASSAM
jgi:alkyldihydroxyacetonephosphate synthase